MPVNFTYATEENLLPISGIQLWIADAGIKKLNHPDLCCFQLDIGVAVAGVFTQNRFCAAPVQLCQKRLAANAQGIRALVINTGNANAGTGLTGQADALRVTATLSDLWQLPSESILPFSTGVILEPLPVEKIVQGLVKLRPVSYLAAAKAIMTTDTVPKAYSRQLVVDGIKVTITGISKGSGMINPNMATMLGFIATDAAIAPAILNQMIHEIAEVSFNAITVDGDTSTNDSFILMATAKAPHALIDSIEHSLYEPIKAALIEVAQFLAHAIIRDGEGANKFIAITVQDGKTVIDCKKIAYAVAHSPLVKTAFFASDPNLGRILAAIGSANVEIDINRLNLYLDEVLVVEKGSRSANYDEADGQRILSKSDIEIRVELGLGEAKTTVWTCDLSHDYVSINADYRS
ncbi:MAG: bifunctional glutamate N-acetyltransferase/amino-acid acetyltransferase ArgJ [Neisseriaceae bacterium]|nr:bifunctional glutamate N-acetyltransferase/amino-acid acetyltransferase ArgJ [Neisseriaceae bacterium]